MSEYGIVTESPTLLQVVAGEVVEKYLTVDAEATVAPGQVYEWDPEAKNYVDYTAGSNAEKYAVCNQVTTTIDADTQVRCVIEGTVRLSKLNSTARNDDDIEVALHKSGIKLLP